MRLRPAQAGALSSAEIAEALDLGSELFTVRSCIVQLMNDACALIC